jgi:PadR family transcriptional regulator AphA
VDRSESTPNLTPTSHLVLGMVGHLGEATSYQMKQLVGATIGGFWPVPHSQLYAEPARLAAIGLLHERREPAGRKKRTYRLTDEGRSALDAWLASADEAPGELRDESLLKLFFGAQAGPGAVTAFARRAGAAHRERLAAYEHLVAHPPVGSDLHQLSILALVCRYEAEAISFWDAVAVDPDLAGGPMARAEAAAMRGTRSIERVPPDVRPPHLA